MALENATPAPVEVVETVEIKADPPTTAQLLAKLGDTAHLAGNQPIGFGGGSQ